jgi:ABC-2 type transport system ATP-binding protein
MSNLAIDISGLTKIYYPGGRHLNKLALDNVDLKIPKGAIYGLLGPNGAGKSTLINIMAGLVMRSAGSVKIWGVETHDDPRYTKSAIGVVPQEINYDPFFTPEKLLDIQAGLYGVPKKERRTEELLALVGLSDQAKLYTRALSGGMKRRLMVAKAMVHNPPVLVLDEPTAGVDVELRQEMWQNVRNLNKRGITILLTTHYLQEAEELCDRIAIINHGKIIVDESKENLLSRIETKDMVFHLAAPVNDIPPSLQKFSPQKEGRNTIMIRYSPREYSAGAVIAAVQQAGLEISDLTTRQGDLEDIFMQMTASGT